MQHPLSYFSFCPHCGSKKFEENNFKSKRCLTCGFVYYANASAATACFIRNKKNEILIARRAKDPAKGTLDLPGGFVDMNETAEEAICREIREETSLKITTPRYLFSLPNIYIYSGMEIHTLDMFFEADMIENNLPNAADDVAELFFSPLEQLIPSSFGLNSIKAAVEKYLFLSLCKEK
ncbi:MAG: NUDIX domain-containing protein [Bacteroidales bacterium]|nr:NUDIX domain-containing protein [Bacteroidales bacterium]